LVLIYKKNNGEVTRVGFSISKKFGTAVKRNRIKRQLREIYSHRLSDIKPGYDLIFIVRKGARDADFHKLKKQMENLLDRAGLI
jgi:ribonuclease P protein component